MVIVTTTVKLKPQKLQACLELFSEKVPSLVAKQGDWVGSTLTIDRGENTICVLSTWRNADSFARLRDSKPYAETMGCFAPLFDGAPEIRINEVVFSQGRGIGA